MIDEATVIRWLHSGGWSDLLIDETTVIKGRILGGWSDLPSLLIDDATVIRLLNSRWVVCLTVDC